MNDLATVLILLSLVGLIVGAVKPSVVRMASRKKALMIFGGALVFSFIMFGVTASPVKTETASKSPQPTVAKTQDQVLADIGQSAASEAHTAKISYKDTKVEKADSDRPTGSKMVTMSFNVSSFYDKSSFIRDTGKVSSKAIQGIFASDSNFYDVIVWFYGKTKDRYGNESDNVLMSYAIDRPTFAKINWSNFDTTKLCDFLQQENRLNGSNLNTVCSILANIE